MVSRRSFIKRCVAAGVGLAALQMGVISCRRSSKASLWDETDMNHLHLRNRIIRASTWESMASEDGRPTPGQIEHYETLAKGGAGAIITGCVCVQRDVPYFANCMRLWTDDFIPQYRELTTRVKAAGSSILAQLALNRYLRPSDGALVDIDDLSEEDIHDVIALFRDAAVRAQAAGFDGVQVMAAHAFFLSRSLSPLYNHRTDAYGGPVENRARMTAEVLDAIRRDCPGLHLNLKMHFPDGAPGGNSEEDIVEICRILEQHGADSFETSGDQPIREGIRAGKDEAYFLDFAKLLKRNVNVPVICLGGVRSYEMASSIIEDGHADYVSMARPFVREPNLPNRWKSGDRRPARCISCGRCFSMLPERKCVYEA